MNGLPPLYGSGTLSSSVTSGAHCNYTFSSVSDITDFSYCEETTPLWKYPVVTLSGAFSDRANGAAIFLKQIGYKFNDDDAKIIAASN